MRDRKKALAVLGSLKGIRTAVIARCLQMSRKTVARYSSCFASGGLDALLPAKAAKPKDDPEREQLLFSLLHSPPSAHGINRTSWRMNDLHRIMAESGHRTSKKRIRTLIKTAGFKWRKAKIVLTSNDPEYHAKVEVIKQILSGLKEDEAFFSIDEYGPFAIKRKGGSKRVGPGENYVVPQYQKSKGWLILTAALELSRNQITHFYSLKKNTEEMIKMADLLRAEYRDLPDDLSLVGCRLMAHIEKAIFASGRDQPVGNSKRLPDREDSAPACWRAVPQRNRVGLQRHG